MPIIRRGEIGAKPDWVPYSAFGVFKAGKGGSSDLHFHDCNEYWAIVEGRARVLSEGVESEVGPGDMVCTKMGTEHQIVEVLEDLTLVFIADELMGQRRKGHLHREGA